MNHAQHIEAVDLCLYHVAPLAESGAGVLAAEAMWGAAVHVIDAVNHARRVNRHPGSNRDRRNILRYLEEKYNLGSWLTAHFRFWLLNLHNHFYTGRLSEVDLREHLEKGRAFVATMIELSARELTTR